ncbi:MAG: NHL repeat-containing protein [bacterium]
MFNKIFTLLTIIIILLIIGGGLYIFFVIFGGTTSIKVSMGQNFQWQDFEPTAIALEPTIKTLFVTDNKSKSIKKFIVSEESISYSSNIGRLGNDVGEFRHPVDIAIDKNSFVYVLDFYLSKVTKMDSYGKVIWEFGKFGNAETDLANPKGLGIDRIGFLYIADSSNNRIVKIDLNGNFNMLFGKLGKEPFQFNNPSDVAVDSKGYIYVCDTNNDRIQIFDSNANFISYTNYENQLQKPEKIYISEDDSLYIIASNSIIKASSNKVLKNINPFFDRKRYQMIDILKWVDKIYILYIDKQSGKGGIKVQIEN